MRLLDKAHRINPVYLRVRGLGRPVSGIMLCDYPTKNFSLRAGQHVFVLDNAYVTPPTTSSEETDASETSDYSTCSFCCAHHHHRHRGCENCGVSLSTTTETTTSDMDAGDTEMRIREEVQIPRRRRHDTSDSSTAIGDTSSRSDESSTATSSPPCSHTFCSQKEPLMWKVRTSDGSLVVDVPAVTVMIDEHDEEAISHAYG